jgi:hypothetical protein
MWQKQDFFDRCRANTIVAAGYEVIAADLTSKKIDIEKKN